MSTINVTFDNAEVERWLDAAPKRIFSAKNSAIRTTATFARRELQRRVTAATGLPSRVFKVFRIKRRDAIGRSTVWIGANPVEAAYVGKLQQEPSGASAGEFFWEGAFVATLRSGHTSIFKRKGRKRLPIVEQVVDLPMVKAIAKEVADLSQIELQRRFIAKLEAK